MIVDKDGNVLATATKPVKIFDTLASYNTWKSGIPAGRTESDYIVFQNYGPINTAKTLSENISLMNTYGTGTATKELKDRLDKIDNKTAGTVSADLQSQINDIATIMNNLIVTSKPTGTANLGDMKIHKTVSGSNVHLALYVYTNTGWQLVNKVN